MKDKFKSVTCSAENIEAVCYSVLNFSLSLVMMPREKNLRERAAEMCWLIQSVQGVQIAALSKGKRVKTS